MMNPPGGTFEYMPTPQALVYLLEKATGHSFISYVDQNLLVPLGILNYQGDTDIYPRYEHTTA